MLRDCSYCFVELRKCKLNRDKDQEIENVHMWLKTTYICYHFPPGLVPLSVVGPLLFLLQHTFSCCAILQGKLAQDFAKAMNADLTYRIYWMAQEQQEGMKPAKTSCHHELVETMFKLERICRESHSWNVTDTRISDNRSTFSKMH